MKLFSLLACLITWLLSHPYASAQRYLPHLIRHDASQRLYPVEAARVMAWIANQKADKVSEVRWILSSKQDGAGELSLTWHAAGGAEIARAGMNYDEQVLDSGAAYFRQGWQQLAKGFGMAATAKPETAEAVSAAFWKGFASEELSRMTVVMNLEKWDGLGKAPNSALHAAELAGRLARAARPILAGSCMLDHLCLARSAAWLCHAESLAGVQAPREWAVISYLGGREIPASKAWKAAQGAAHEDMPAWRWWNAVMTSYPMSLRDMCKLAVEPNMKDEGLLFMLGHARMESGQITALSNIIAQLHRESLLKHADVSQTLLEEFTFTSLRGACFMIPQVQIHEWLQAMAGQLQPGGDDTINQMAEQAEPLTSTFLKTRDMNEAISQIGGLVTLSAAHRPRMQPVAAVSADDLVVHGWEITLLNWRLTYYFLEHSLGVPAEAAKFAEAVTKHAPSLIFAMQRLDTQEAIDTGKPALWLEYLDEKTLRRLLISEYNKPDPKTGKRLRFQGPMLHGFYMRGESCYRHWLMAHGNPSLLAYGVRRSGKLLEQGGENSISQALRFIHWQTNKPENLALLKEAETEILAQIEAACPNAFSLQSRSLIRRLEKENANDLTKASAFEKNYWLAPGYDDVDLIMEHYLVANAPAVAIRFYEQAREIGGDSVYFSNVPVPIRWMLAWWQKDAVGMQKAAKDSPSYSARDLEKHAIHEFCLPMHGKAEQVIKAYAERYKGEGSATAWLEEVIPVFNALKKTDHPNHDEAWQVMLRGHAFPHLQFVLLRHAGVSDAESARRFDQPGLPATQQLLRAYWLADADSFNQITTNSRNALIKNIHPMTRALIPLMEAELMKKPLIESLPDLKPAEEPRLDLMVRRLLEKK